MSVCTWLGLEVLTLQIPGGIMRQSLEIPWLGLVRWWFSGVFYAPSSVQNILYWANTVRMKYWFNPELPQPYFNKKYRISTRSKVVVHLIHLSLFKYYRHTDRLYSLCLTEAPFGHGTSIFFLLSQGLSFSGEKWLNTFTYSSEGFLL